MKFASLLLFGLAALLPATLLAEVRVTVPERVPLQTLVTISVEGADEAAVAAMSVATGAETPALEIVSPPGRRQWFFIGPAGQYVVGVSYDEAEAKTQRLFRVVIGDAAPPAPVDPTPPKPDDPKPDDPDPPAPATTLAEKVASWRAAIQYAKAADHAAALASAYLSLAGEAEAGTYKAPRDLILATATQADAILGADAPKWTKLREGLRTELNALAAAGKLTAMADHARVWREIAEGLGS